MSDEKFIVIGAGLPRTGTLSLKTALEHLLGGPCYHMKPFILHGGRYDAQHWNEALVAYINSESLPKESWTQFLEARGYRSGVDYPLSFFYKDLMEVFPAAKVVLTVRSPESWRESVLNGIVRTQKVIRKFPVSWLIKLQGGSERTDVANSFSWAAPHGFDDSMFSAVKGGPEKSNRFFEQWVETVKATVPADRLLVFEVKQGWEPLCKFLGLAVPEIPFPRVNDTASMQSMVNNVQRAAWFLTFALPALVGGVIYYYFQDCISNLIS